MTAMDKKINELNEKLGNKTGIDAKGSIKAIGKEIYDNKSYLTGVGAAGVLFVFTTTGLIFSVLGGVGAGIAYNKVVAKITKRSK